MLTPSARTPAGYRRYSGADATRLAWICRYRRAGLSLDTIRELLDSGNERRAATLAARLSALNGELHRVRAQQRFILELLGPDPRHESMTFLSRSTFLALFDLAGISADQRERWHAAFEQLAEDQHQAFLEFLCLSDDAIDRIRHHATHTPAPPPGNT